MRSAVQVQSSLRESDFMEKPVGPRRGFARQFAEADLLGHVVRSLMVPLLGTSAEPPQSLTWMVSYFFPGAGPDPRSCCDHAARSGARLPGVRPDSRLRRDYAAPAVSAAVLLGAGANSRLRLDFAAPVDYAAPLFWLDVIIAFDATLLFVHLG